MGIHQKTTVCAICVALVSSFTGGCGGPAETPLTTEIDLGTTIGSLTEIFAVQSIPVDGYGLVGGLGGTGSAECPPEIRTYLRQYILARLPESRVGVDELINSRNTAVVRVHGMMPAAITKNEPFDVRVDGLAGTQTTSLEGGSLYGTDLKEEGSFGITTRILATAEGPVFIDTIGPNAADKRLGYVLGGGRVRDEYKIRLALRQPDYLVARRISNLLDGRFGSGTAKAVQPDLITLRVPAKYRGQKQRFISIVSATYVTETPEVVEERIDTFVRTLATSKDKEASEITLEAIGNRCVKKLAILLNSADEEVRLRAARCMLNLGSDQGLQTLREIATNTRSVYQSAEDCCATRSLTSGWRHMSNCENWTISP
jgi:flagellar basal body P-ring protein FlgI